MKNESKKSNDLYNKYKNKGERKMQIADAITTLNRLCVFLLYT